MSVTAFQHVVELTIHRSLRIPSSVSDTKEWLRNFSLLNERVISRKDEISNCVKLISMGIENHASKLTIEANKYKYFFTFSFKNQKDSIKFDNAIKDAF